MEKEDQRYSRHYTLKGFGEVGQQKLTNSAVLVIGAGGLGCPVLQYLAASGIGKIGIADDDVVSVSNLQRQVLYSTDDVGAYKADIAGTKLRQLNPHITINIHKTLVTNNNVLELIHDYDVIVDCTDNFAARYIINDACVLANKPLIFGAIYQYEGQVAVFNVEDKLNIKTNYRNLFPIPPGALEVPDCNETGVLGVLPGIIGTIQATEVVKLLTGVGEVLVNKILNFSLLTYDIFIADICYNESVLNYLPKDTDAFKVLDYNWLCGTSVNGITEVEPHNFIDSIHNHDHDMMVIDVRDIDEQPKVQFKNHNIPLSNFEISMPDINEQNIVLFCQSGRRSLKAAQMLIEKYGNSKNISHLKGGLNAIQEYINNE